MTKTREVVKKLLTAVSLTAAVSMAAVFVTHTNVYAAEAVCGDADGDGVVGANDALAVLKNCTQIIELSEEAAKAADVDADGETTASDALIILKRVVLLIDRFETENALAAEAAQEEQISVQVKQFSIDDMPPEVDREIVITLQNGETKTVTGHFDKACEDEIVRLLNEYREANGLRALSVNENLVYGAEVRVYEATAVWAHVRPDGSEWYSVTEEAYGENLASGYADAEAAMEGWMASPGHNANMLKADFESVGIGVFAVLTESENGAYYTYYFAQLFGY